MKGDLFARLTIAAVQLVERLYRQSRDCVWCIFRWEAEPMSMRLNFIEYNYHTETTTFLHNLCTIYLYYQFERLKNRSNNK